MADPAPFDIDLHFNEAAKDLPVEQVAEKRESMSGVLYELARPFLGQGYNTVAALNRGTAGFYAHLDSVAQFLENRGLGESGGLFDKMAQISESKADYWAKRADEVGLNFIDEVVSEAVGGAPPGIATFALDVASGYTFPAAAGAAQAEATGENPVVAGLISAAKTATLSQLFRVMAPLKQYLKAPAMGTVFGIQEMEAAPEGSKTKAFVKGAAIGAGYALTSPGGRLGLNEIMEGVRSQMPEKGAPLPERAKPAVRPPKEADALAREAAFWNEDLAQNPQPSRNAMDEAKAPERLRARKYGTPPTPAELERILDEQARTAQAKEPTASMPSREQPRGRQRQRKFLKTAAEAVEIQPELAGKIKDINPQNYTVITNKESQAAARNRIERDGLDAAREYVLDTKTFLDVEKSATASELIRQYQRNGELDRATEITESLAVQLTRAGQGVQSAAQWVALSPQGFIRWGNRQLDAVRKRYSFLDAAIGRKPNSFELTPEDIAKIQDLHRRANSLPDGQEKADLSLQMVDVVAQKVPPSISEMFDAYRYSNMLSSPKTQLRNISENLFNTFMSRPWDIATQGAVDYLKAGLTGKQRERYIKDSLLYEKAALNAMPNAVEAFKETWSMGTSSTLEKPEIGVESKNAFEQLRAKQLPESLTAVSRFMEASDKFNIALISAGEMARLTKEGVEPSLAYQQSKEVAKIYLYRPKLDPSDPRLSWPSRALAALGDIAMKTRQTPAIGTVAKWYIPFITTPVNKAIRMTEYSPLTLIRDPRTLADTEVAGRALSGAIVTGIGAAVTYSNETTWTAPTNAEEKNWFYATGRKPFSVKFGDNWVPVWYLGPFALAFGIPMAAKHYYTGRPESMTDEGYEKLGALAQGAAEFIGSQSSTQSIGALFSALQGDIDYNVRNQSGFMVQQVIPASALVRYINTIIDPVYRHPRGFYEQIEANLPLFSENIDARLTPFLEESTREPINNFLPYDIGKSDPIYESMYPIIQTSTRAKYLQNYAKRQGIMSKDIEKLIGSIKRGEVLPEESFDAFGKIVNAAPKVVEPLTGE